MSKDRENGLGVWQFDHGGIIDWVAAKSREEAAQHLVDAFEHETDGEVVTEITDLDERILLDLDHYLETGEKKYRSFREEIQNCPADWFPYIIASTDY